MNLPEFTDTASKNRPHSPPITSTHSSTWRIPCCLFTDSLWTEVAIALAVASISLAQRLYRRTFRLVSSPSPRVVTAAGFQPTQADWAAAFALVITGVAYIPVELVLRTRSLRSGTMGPRRGFVFTLLALGALTGATGAVAILYAVITNLLQAPVADWQHVARLGAVALLVGAVLAGIYVWQAVREGFFKRPAPTQPELAAVAPPAPSEPLDSVESMLDAYCSIPQRRSKKRRCGRYLTNPDSDDGKHVHFVPQWGQE